MTLEQAIQTILQMEDSNELSFHYNTESSQIELYYEAIKALRQHIAEKKAASKD